MSVYKQRLPEVFPFCLTATTGEVRGMVAHLIFEIRIDVPQGSSFAVTTDNWDGTWNLWLSSISAATLRARFPNLDFVRTVADF